MNLKGFSKYLGFFITGVLLIAVYKTFDNFSLIWQGVLTVFSALSPFVFGALIAFLLYNPCRKLEALFLKVKSPWLKKHRRGIAVISVYLLALLLLGGFFALLLPVITRSIVDLASQAPLLWQKALVFIGSLEEWGISVSAVTENLSFENIMQTLDLSNVSRYAQGVWSAGASIFNFIMSVIVSVYVLLDRAVIKQATLRGANVLIKKESARNTFYKYAGRSVQYMNTYISCKVIESLIVGVLAFFVMLPFRVPYVALMALLTAVFNLIPYFGSFVATILAAGLTAITVDPIRGIWVAVALIVLQQFDANVLQPRIVKEAMNIKPLWVIFSILLFGALFGFWGILLGVPLMALILSAIEDLMHMAEKKKTQENE